jgi:ankyrin repeat protein
MELKVAPAWSLTSDANQKIAAGLLLKFKADSSMRSSEGKTPLDIAVLYGRKECADLLSRYPTK